MRMNVKELSIGIFGRYIEVWEFLNYYYYHYSYPKKDLSMDAYFLGPCRIVSFGKSFSVESKESMKSTKSIQGVHENREYLRNPLSGEYPCPQLIAGHGVY